MSPVDDGWMTPSVNRKPNGGKEDGEEEERNKDDGTRDGAAGEENRGEAARPATYPPYPRPATYPPREEKEKPTYPSILTPPIDPNLLPDDWPFFR